MDFLSKQEFDQKLKEKKKTGELPGGFIFHFTGQSKEESFVGFTFLIGFCLLDIFLKSQIKRGITVISIVIFVWFFTIFQNSWSYASWHLLRPPFLRF